VPENTDADSTTGGPQPYLSRGRRAAPAVGRVV